MEHEYEQENMEQQEESPAEINAPMAAPEPMTPPEPVHTALTAVSAKKKAPRLNPPEAPALPAPPEEAPAPDPNERVPVVDVQFRPGSKIYFFDPGELQLKNGDHVIIDTARGAEYGYCLSANHRIARRELVQPLRRVLRVANAIDRRIKTENEKKEKDAYAFCQRKIQDLKLDMQLVSAECAYDGSKLLFFFTADNRVDFRELVKILASNFHMRIELRQIGVRDKAKMLGGLGICGRPFCCASFLEDFQPVSIKMAKTQSLSLNPTKISGTCGRLMCCLKYEQEAYEDLIRSSPKPDSFVDTPDGRGTVTAVNLMKQSVTVRMEKDEESLQSYRNCDICVLRSGKAKKNDPPIPEDLAPISGRRDGELRERRPFLDHRLTLDPAEAEPTEPEEPEDVLEQTAPERPAQEARPRRNRRDWKQERPEQAERPEMQEKNEKPARRDNPKREGERRDGSQQPAASEGGSRRGKRYNKPEGQRGEKPEKQERAEKAVQLEQKQGDKPSRSQRRRQQQGKQEPKLPLPEQPKRPAPEKRPEEQPAPKPEAKKNNKRRYYHNRKPKG